MELDLEFEYRVLTEKHSWRVEGLGEIICQWMGNEDFQYKIFRFWEKYGQETVFSTLEGDGN